MVNASLSQGKNNPKAQTITISAGFQATGRRGGWAQSSGHGEASEVAPRPALGGGVGAGGRVCPISPDGHTDGCPQTSSLELGRVFLETWFHILPQMKHTALQSAASGTILHLSPNQLLTSHPCSTWTPATAASSPIPRKPESQHPLHTAMEVVSMLNDTGRSTV